MSQANLDNAAKAMAIWCAERGQRGLPEYWLRNQRKFSNLIGRPPDEAFHVFRQDPAASNPPAPLACLAVISHERLQPANIARLSVIGVLGFGQTAAEVMATTEGADGIFVLINSGGGDLDLGLQLYDALRAREGVEVCIQGLAGSASAILAQAGALRQIKSDACVMLHSVCVTAMGAPDYLRQKANDGDKSNARMLEILTERTGQPTAVVQSWIRSDGDTYFDAEQALAAGLVDAIIP